MWDILKNIVLQTKLTVY